MSETVDLNRMEYMIIETLYQMECVDKFHSMTITELLDTNEGTLGTRMTVYRKLKKLLAAHYISKGCLDNHADTFYLLEKGIRTVEGGNE